MIIIGYIYAVDLAQVSSLVFLAALAGAASAGPHFALISEVTPSELRASLVSLFNLSMGLMQTIG